MDPQTHCYTLEVSFFSYTTTDPHTQAPYTEEACIPPHTPPQTHTLRHPTQRRPVSLHTHHSHTTHTPHTTHTTQSLPIKLKP